MADIFFPRFCQTEIDKINCSSFQEGILVSKKSVNLDKHICKHSKSCKICGAIASIKFHDLRKKVEIHELVKQSDKHNFEGCRFPVN